MQKQESQYQRMWKTELTIAGLCGVLWDVEKTEVPGYYITIEKWKVSLT